jgi:hypothetical protein
MLELWSTRDAPSNNSTLEIHGVSWEQIKNCNQLIDKQITIEGGMSKIGLPLSVYQSRHQGLLLRGTIQQCYGNWVGTNMSIGFVIAAAHSKDSGGGGGGGGGGDSGGGGDGGGGAGAQSLTRTGARSIDRMRYARSRTSFAALRPTVTGMEAGGGGLGGSGGGGGFANFIGGTISNFIGGGTPGITNPLNLIHNLLPNMPLSGAIQQTLSKALSGVPLRIAIHPSLKLAYQDAGMYQNMTQYIGYLNKLSQSILGATQGDKNYLGVAASSKGLSLDIWDGTKAFGTTDVTAGDLIGQPTWVGRYLVQVKVVMRNDIDINTDVTLPATIYNVGPEGNLPFATSAQISNITIPTTIRVQHVRHIGDFRNPDGNSWCTIIEGNPVGGLISLTPELVAEQLKQNPVPNLPL